MRLRLVPILLGAIAVSVALTPGRASAFVARRSVAVELEFDNLSCGQHQTHVVRLRRGAYHLAVSVPKTGARLRDLGTDAVVARVTDVHVRRVGTRRRVVLSVVGSDDLCSNPDAYAGIGSAAATTVRASYRIRLRGRRFRGYVA